MRSRRFAHRPNRRQRSLASFNVAPLCLQYGTPGIDAGNTFFTLPLSQFRARVDTQTGGDAVTAIKLVGFIDGVFGTYPAALIRNDGEDGDGTLVTIKFLGVLDNDQPWILSIPASTPLIQSRFGGRLSGTLNQFESLDDLAFGAVRMSNYEDVGVSLPVLNRVTTATVISGTEITLTTDLGAPNPWGALDRFKILYDDISTPDSVADAGGGSILVTVSGGVATTKSVTMTDWKNFGRGADGSYLAPFRVITF